ncbi:hypothetical protein AsAng_0028110 [Aureispira anguillae]|uniref:Uncharacterized protein n=1 Tax=Aureispira anguillae TaxID=2864201 RepID=A0A916DST3_9BACT|nr:hypothetical protein AsAng_0028110 [Aureispira anguillae]
MLKAYVFYSNLYHHLLFFFAKTLLIKRSIDLDNEVFN